MRQLVRRQNQDGALNARQDASTPQAEGSNPTPQQDLAPCSQANPNVSTLCTPVVSTPSATPTQTGVSDIVNTTSASASIPAATAAPPVSGSMSVTHRPGPQATENGGQAAPGSTPPETTSVSKGGVPKGTVAGVAISMLIAGALIAGAVFFFLLRRQKKKQSAATANYQAFRPPYNDPAVLSEKGPTVATSALTANIDNVLPQPVADETITDAVLKIRDNIKNHVRTYYHSAQVEESAVDQAALGALATVTGVSSAVLAGSLSNPSTRPEVLRLVIGWVVLSRCTGEGDPSLLPTQLSELAAFIPGGDGNNATQSLMYSKWKAITGALLQQRFGHGMQGLGRDQTFSNATADLDSIVAPFVQGSLDGSQRGKNLDMILTRSASFAFLLFSQPGSFRFDFLAVHGGLVLFPALVQTIGDQGQVLRPARVLLEKEVAA